MAVSAHLSHEIRSPLTVLLSCADRLAADLVESPQQQLAEAIVRSGRHLLTLVNDGLDWSKIEAGKGTSTPQTVVLMPFLREVHELMGWRAKERGLGLYLDCATPLPATLTTDPVGLKQILFNLLANAIQFTQRGEIRLQVTYQDVRDRPGGQLQFAVIDTGMGLDLEQCQRVFEPFYRVRPGVDGDSGGTGLGLAISRRLAALLGGELTVTSVPRRGSTFALTLGLGPPPRGPWSEPQVVAFGQGVVSPSPDLSPRDSPPGQQEGEDEECPPATRVLEVDDDEDVGSAMALVLSHAGYDITIATCGATALATAATRSFDAVLIDIHLPDQDGFSLASALRAQPTMAKALFVALSGDGHAALEDRRSVFDHCLTKPADLAALEGLLARRGKP
ncbi:MAG: hybrid sensor histidine kinase/response regulator [Candidatus Competibacterales bacterium]